MTTQQVPQPGAVRRNVRVLTGLHEFDIAEALRETVTAAGATVEIKSLAVQQSSRLSPRFSHFIVILPRAASPGSNDVLRVRRMVDRLQCLTTAPRTPEGTTIAIVQFGGGMFGTGTEPVDLEQCCAASFARTLHIERPDLKIRVVDLAPSVEPQRAAELVLAEMAGPEALTIIGYDVEGKRRVPRARIQQPARYHRRPHHWSNEDVVLVTGGAKGITAECSLALARNTGAKFALVGSSPEPTADEGESHEIVQTLHRFADEDVECRYFSCDVADAAAVQTLIERVRTEMGPITGVIHGAGVNKPRPAEIVSADEAFREVSPKLLGALNLGRTLADAPPRMFVGLTSIIGVTGMPGNAWYAFSNEALDIVLRRFEAEHPETSVLSIAYSVWGETGMGHRMDSLRTLGRMGIGAIPTEEGVRRFVQLFEFDPGVKQVVVTARLGGLDTWPIEEPEPPADLRFLENIVRCQPGVELVARTRLTLERDRYIADHDYRGSYLFPTVFGLEAMAQAAAFITGDDRPPIARIENISLERPIAVDPDKGVEIEIRAEAAEETTTGEMAVRVGIRTEQTGFSVDHFAATFILGTLPQSPQTPHSLEGRTPLDVRPQTDLYGGLLFQGPLFQRMGRIYELDGDHTVFESDARTESELAAQSFPSDASNRLLLDDPSLRDVLLQAGQLTIPQEVCLPVRIERIERFAPAEATPGRRIVVAPHKVRHGREYVAEVFVTDEQGRMLERLTGYWLRILEERPDSPTAEELALPDERDQTTLQHALQQALAGTELVAPSIALANLSDLHELPRAERRERERPVIDRARQTALGTDSVTGQTAEIVWLPAGKPQFADNFGLDLSIAHDDRYCLCTVGSEPQGCDIAPVMSRTEENWIALLGEGRRPLLETLVAQGDSLDQAGTRIWAAVEALRKATQVEDIDLAIDRRRERSVLLAATNLSGRPLALTLPVRLTRGPERIVAAVLADLNRKSNPVSVPFTATEEGGIHPMCHSVSVSDDGPQGQPVQELRFVVSFQEASTLSRHVPAAQYLKWMGRMRELVTSANVPELVPLISTGQWGLVTNWGDVHVHGELTANDVVQMRFWTNPARGSEVEFFCDFWKLRPDGGREQAAFAEQKATWVRLIGHGQVAPEPLPLQLAEFINRMGPRHDGPQHMPGLPQPLAGLKPGEMLFTAPAGPAAGPHVFSQSFETTLEEANLVGNIYFANYFAWQQRVRDLFVNSVAPECLRGVGAEGEMLCLRSRMDYLREAMPFDRVHVLMSLKSLSECGASFGFEFYRGLPEGGRQKLSIGRHDVLWVRRGAGASPLPTPWPPALRKALLGSAAARQWPTPALSAPGMLQNQLRPEREKDDALAL